MFKTLLARTLAILICLSLTMGGVPAQSSKTSCPMKTAATEVMKPMPHCKHCPVGQPHHSKEQKQKSCCDEGICGAMCKAANSNVGAVLAAGVVASPAMEVASIMSVSLQNVPVASRLNTQDRPPKSLA